MIVIIWTFVFTFLKHFNYWLLLKLGQYDLVKKSYCDYCGHYYDCTIINNIMRLVWFHSVKQWWCWSFQLQSSCFWILVESYWPNANHIFIQTTFSFIHIFHISFFNYYHFFLFFCVVILLCSWMVAPLQTMIPLLCVWT